MVHAKSKGNRRVDQAILITGGSGFIGRAVVRRLAENGETVVCMYHHRLPEPMANVYPVCSDMGSSELIAAPLRGVDTVVHLAWEGGFVGPSEPVSWNLNPNSLPKNARILKNLLSAMERAGTRRIIFLSAVGASRNAKTPFLQEKYLSEFLILNSKVPEKVVLRSSIVCGGGDTNDRFLRSILRVMQFPGIYPVPSQAERLAPLHIGDVAQILCDSATTTLPQSCAVMEVSGQEDFRIEELFKLVSERYVKGAKLPVSGFLGTSLLPFFERDSKQNPNVVKLRHFLALGNHADAATRLKNPLSAVLPEKFQSFRDTLADTKTA